MTPNSTWNPKTGEFKELSHKKWNNFNNVSDKIQRIFVKINCYKNFFLLIFDYLCIFSFISGCLLLKFKFFGTKIYFTTILLKNQDKMSKLFDRTLLNWEVNLVFYIVGCAIDSLIYHKLKELSLWFKILVWFYLTTMETNNKYDY